MANANIDDVIKDLVQKLKKWTDDAATLTVTTNVIVTTGPVEDGVDFEAAKKVAETTIGIDGDMTETLPVRRVDDHLELDAAIFEIHKASVSASMDYRKGLLDTLTKLIRPEKS